MHSSLFSLHDLLRHLFSNQAHELCAEVVVQSEISLARRNAALKANFAIQIAMVYFDV